MKDIFRKFTPWLAFAIGVLVVFVLYWAQAVFVPIALAILLTFVLAPPVTWLQRWVGRVAAVLIVAIVVFATLALATYGLGRQLSTVVNDLPAYRVNIRQKIADIRVAQNGGSVQKFQRTLDEIKQDLARAQGERAAAEPRPVVVVPTKDSSWWGMPAMVAPLLDPLATAGLVIALTIFMLLERAELRARLMRIVGHGRVAQTTKALDEAATRVSRQLLTQTAINLTYGTGLAIGLTLIGVPYPLLWATLAAMLRFIPYIGTSIGALMPILLSLAAMSGWVRPMLVVALFVGLELFTYLVLETVLYAGAAGISQVGLLISVAFWTWLWGPLGLLMAVPLTVCLVVLGKHVAGLEVLSTLMADDPGLPQDQIYYQRLLAHDQSEAWELIEKYLKEHEEAPETVYDALLLPALNYAERDRYDDRLTPDMERDVVEGTRELLADVSAALATARPRSGPRDRESPPFRVFGYATNEGADALSLKMLEQLAEYQAETTAIVWEMSTARMLSAEVVEFARQHDVRAIVIADLPPSPASKTRYLVRKLRAALPDLPILIGRWAPPHVADENAQALLDSGAIHVASTLADTAAQLRQLAAYTPAKQEQFANADTSQLVP